MTKIYKYLGPDIAMLLEFDDNISDDWKHFGIKMSTLDQYNDPYERFLTIDFSNKPPGLIAYYEDIINMYKDLLVSCFSVRPDITPMWAHYANNMSGFVLEINETKLKEYFEKSGKKINGLENIEYRDTPDPNIENYLMRAATTLKPRHLHWLNQALIFAMYFYKQSYWNYEEEKRLVITKSLTHKLNGIYLLPIPFSCLDSIILGKNIAPKTKVILTDISRKYGIKVYDMNIGKSYPRPYFISEDKETFIFDKTGLKSTKGCEKCFEVITNSSNLCSWCGISTLDRDMAQSMNSFRILDRIGILEKTLAGYRSIDKSHSKK